MQVSGRSVARIDRRSEEASARVPSPFPVALHCSGTARPLVPFTARIAITITPAAHQAIKTSLLRTTDAPPRPGPDGLIRIWLDRQFVDRLGQMRGTGETYSDVMLRMAAVGS